MAKKDENKSIGEALEDVRWDARKAKGKASLLTPMSRYFNDFPWEGERPDPAAEKADPTAEEDGEEP